MNKDDNFHSHFSDFNEAAEKLSRRTSQLSAERVMGTFQSEPDKLLSYSERFNTHAFRQRLSFVSTLAFPSATVAYMALNQPHPSLAAVSVGLGAMFVSFFSSVHFNNCCDDVVDQVKQDVGRRETSAERFEGFVSPLDLPIVDC